MSSMIIFISFLLLLIIEGELRLTWFLPQRDTYAPQGFGHISYKISIPIYNRNRDKKF